MWRSINSWRSHVITIAAIACLGTSSGALADEVATPVRAVWQVQEIYLSYFGFTTYYSCDSLRDKVRSAIAQLGAREDSVVSIAGCDELSGPARSPSVRIVMATPVVATSAIAAEQSKDPKRAELLAKLQRKDQAPLSDEPFDAVRKTITLATKDSTVSTSSAGDCELVEHLRDKVIKKMDARIVKDDLRCVPHQGTVGNPKLQVEVLAKK